MFLHQFQRKFVHRWPYHSALMLAGNSLLTRYQQDIPSSQVTDPPCGSILTKFLKQFGLLGYGSEALQDEEDTNSDVDTKSDVDRAKLLSPIPGLVQIHTPNGAHSHLMLCLPYHPNKQNDTTQFCVLSIVMFDKGASYFV